MLVQLDIAIFQLGRFSISLSVFNTHEKYKNHALIKTAFPWDFFSNHLFLLNENVPEIFKDSIEIVYE